MQTSSSARANALTADEVASRCQEDPEALFLCDIGLADTDIDALAAGLKRAGQNLTVLDVSSNHIADAGLQKLVTAFAGGICPKLTELFIGCNSFGEQGRTMLNGGLRVLRKGLTIHAEDAVSERPAQELSKPAIAPQEVAITEQEAKCCDVGTPASRKQKSPTGGDTSAGSGGYNTDSLRCASVADQPHQARVEEAANAFSGSATIVEGAEGQEVHVVVPLAGSSVASAADLDLDMSASEVRITGPGGLSVSVTLPIEVEPGSAQASFSKKRQQMVVKLKSAPSAACL
jgi:hypothetical protein